MPKAKATYVTVGAVAHPVKCKIGDRYDLNFDRIYAFNGLSSCNLKTCVPPSSLYAIQ